MSNFRVQPGLDLPSTQVYEPITTLFREWLKEYYHELIVGLAEDKVRRENSAILWGSDCELEICPGELWVPTIPHILQSPLIFPLTGILLFPTILSLALCIHNSKHPNNHRHCLPFPILASMRKDLVH